MIYLASDHIGTVLKASLNNFLHEKGYRIEDLGPQSKERVNYTDYAKLLCEKLQEDETALGILICGTGIGMSMMANRRKGIRAAVSTNEYMAEMTRRHNNANVLCLGSRVIGEDLAKSIVLRFLTSEFEGGRHLNRIKQFDC